MIACRRLVQTARRIGWQWRLAREPRNEFASGLTEINASPASSIMISDLLPQAAGYRARFTLAEIR
jgi:hypothetical protein